MPFTEILETPEQNAVALGLDIRQAILLAGQTKSMFPDTMSQILIKLAKVCITAGPIGKSKGTH